MSNVTPTKGNLIATKKSNVLSQLGFELMDKKRNILIKELMLVIKSIKDIQDEIEKTYSEAYSYLQMANVTLGICEKTSNDVPVDDSLKISYRSIMGVEIPVVSLDVPRENEICYDFYSSNSFLDETYKKFCKVKSLTAKLAELESSVYRLTNSIVKTQKRANALKNVIIPKFKSSIKYISDSLEEKEREEFSRLKVIKKKKNDK